MDYNIDLLNGNAPYNLNEIQYKEALFIDRRKNANMLLMVLAGYKPYLYEDVFSLLSNVFKPC